MTQQEQIENVTRYFGGYEPLVKMFAALITASNVADYETYEEFAAKIEANKAEGIDTTLFGFLPLDSENGRQNALYLYLPNICIGWIPLSVIQDLRPDE